MPSDYEIEEVISGRKVRRPANAAEHVQAHRLCRRALDANIHEREALRKRMLRLESEAETLREAIDYHGGAAWGDE